MSKYNYYIVNNKNTTTNTSPLNDSASSTTKQNKIGPVFNYVLRDAGQAQPSIYLQDIPKEQQERILLYFERMIKESNEVVEARDRDAGAISYTVNAWLEIMNSESAKSNIKKNIKDTKKDLQQLKQAANRELLEYNFLTQEMETKSFQETFKTTRGVEYNKENIDDCLEKADKYAQVKTRTEMINQVKSILFGSTKGDVQSQINPETSTNAILKALKMCGLSKKSDVDKFLKDFSENYKDNPIIKKYGGNFQLFKDKQGNYEIYRRSKSGSNEVATNEQLRLIAEELAKNLDREYAKALGVEIPKNATAEQLSELTQQTYNKYKKEYENSFGKAFGKKDIKILSEKFAQTQAQGVAYVEMGVNMLSMATMILPTGAVGLASMTVKGAQATGKGVQAATKALQVAQTVQKGTQAISPVLMANVVLNPVELIEQLSSENGMSAEEWRNWGKGVLENSVYMALGMSASKVATQGAAMYKTRALVKTLQQTGKSADEIAAMINANPVKFPDEIVKSMKSIDKTAKSLQISTESAIDLSTTYLANQVMGNGDLTTTDWIMSVGTAIMGGTIQKQFAPLTTEAKVKYIKDAFKALNLTDDIAMNIMKTMDDISAGKIDPNTGARVLPEVEIVAKSTKNSPNKGADDVASLSNKEGINTEHTQSDTPNIFKLNFEQPTYEQLYKDLAPEYIKQGYSEAAIKNLNYTALRALDEAGASILRNPDDVDIILSRLEKEYGIEVKQHLYDALMSNPENRKIIIEQAKGQSENMRWSTRNWSIEDSNFKMALNHVECFEELNALKQRLFYNLEAAPEDLKPKFEALQKDLFAKSDELAAKCYTHIDGRNINTPLPQPKTFREIIAKQIKEADNDEQLRLLGRDLDSYTNMLAHEEDFTDIRKMISQKKNSLNTQRDISYIEKITNISDLELMELNSNNPQMSTLAKTRKKELIIHLEQAYQDFLTGKSIPDVDTFVGIIDYKIRSCKTLADVSALKNTVNVYNSTNPHKIYAGKAAYLINEAEKSIRINTLENFALKIGQCTTQEEINAIKKDFRNYKKADDYYAELEKGEYFEYKRGEIEHRHGKFGNSKYELADDSSVLDAYRALDNKIRAKEQQITQNNRIVIDFNDPDAVDKLFGDYL